MKSKFLSPLAVAVVALIAAAPLHATTYTVAQFKAALNTKVGTAKGTTAVNKAGSLYKQALSDKANKKFASQYASAITKKLIPLVSTAFRGTGANTLIKQLGIGYFKGLKYNLNDKTYNKAIDIFLKFVPTPQKTAATSQKLYNTIKQLATKNGVPQSTVSAYYTKNVSNKFNFPEPPVS